jgi:hypothetical protein
MGEEGTCWQLRSPKWAAPRWARPRPRTAPPPAPLPPRTSILGSGAASMLAARSIAVSKAERALDALDSRSTLSRPFAEAAALRAS